jgi:hypothetical protein
MPNRKTAGLPIYPPMHSRTPIYLKYFSNTRLGHQFTIKPTFNPGPVTFSSQGVVWSTSLAREKRKRHRYTFFAREENMILVHPYTHLLKEGSGIVLAFFGFFRYAPVECGQYLAAMTTVSVVFWTQVPRVHAHIQSQTGCSYKVLHSGE